MSLTLRSHSSAVLMTTDGAQSRQAEKDRVRSDIEYEVNIKAELEIAHLHEKTDRIYENMMAELSTIKKQLAAK